MKKNQPPNVLYFFHLLLPFFQNHPLHSPLKSQTKPIGLATYIIMQCYLQDYF